MENVSELFRMCHRSQLDHQELQFGITPLGFVLPLVVDCLNQVVRHNEEESLLFLSSSNNASSAFLAEISPYLCFENIHMLSL